MDKEILYQLAIEGWHIFPVGRDKKPLTKHGLKDGTQTRLGIEDYKKQHPGCNWGGFFPGQLIIDVDPRHGGSLGSLTAKYGALPKTRTHKTGGGGYHLIFRQPAGYDIRNTVSLDGLPGVDRRGNGGYIVLPGSIHESGSVYEVIDDSPIAEAPAALLTDNSYRKAESIPGDIPQGQRNQTLASIAGTMRGRGLSVGVIEASLLEVNRLQCKPPLPEAEVIAISQSIGRYTPNGNGNICIYTNVTTLPTHERDKNVTGNVTAEANGEAKTLQQTFATFSERVSDWVKGTSAWWATEDLDKDLGIISATDKTNRRQVLCRLKEDGIIEQHTKINKHFRYINTKITSLNFKTANTAGVLPIRWPLNIEKLVNFFPGNLAVIAGAPNAGKTGFMLNCIYLNQSQFPTYYFCSEMGEVELRDRLDKFPGMDVNDWTFQAIERAADFPDVIRPDCFNLIDFVEMTTDLFQINTILTAISHKIGSGVCLVAIQKKQGAVFGRGQEFGLEKPKLYLSMDKGKLSIVKGKSWAMKGTDPQGLSIKFQISGGCQFEPLTGWVKEGGAEIFRPEKNLLIPKTGELIANPHDFEVETI